MKMNYKTLYIFLCSFIFSQMKHPLTMGFILLMQTVLISLIIGLNFKTFWFSYILFLVFLGGMLVMFIYVVSLSSNEMFSISSNLLISTLMLIFIMLLVMLLVDYYYLTFYNNMEMNHINNYSSFMKENLLELTKIYNYPTNLITLLLILYLFFTFYKFFLWASSNNILNKWMNNYD